MKRIISLLSLITLFFGNILSQEIPHTISYQGVLKDAAGGVVPNGEYILMFKFYNSESGGTELWSETKPINVVDGIINTELGSTEPIPFPIFFESVWLGITIGSGSELTPRIALTSVPYSFMSMNVPDSSINSAKIPAGEVVKSLNGLKDSITLVAGSNITITPSGNDLTISSSGGGTGTIGGSGTSNYIPKFSNATTLTNSTLFETSNKVGIGTTNPKSSLSVGGDGSSGAAISGTSISTGGIGVYGEAINAFGYGVFGYATSSNGIAICGYGLSPALAAFFLGDVSVSGDFSTTGNVGVGTPTPRVKLSLGEDFTAKKLALWDGENDFYGFGVAIGRITFYTNDTEKMTIKDNGNVGINTINPQAKLDVNGSVKIGVNGIKFSELYELTGTTGIGGTDRVSVSYPTGYNKSNTRVISYEVQEIIANKWVSGDEGLWCALGDTDITVGYGTLYTGEPI